MPDSFIGLSIEWIGIRRLMLENKGINAPGGECLGCSGKTSSVVKETLEQWGPLNGKVTNLVSRLRQTGNNTKILVRIGGNSATRLHYAKSKYPRLANQVTGAIYYDQDLVMLDRFAQAAGVKLILNIGMARAGPEVATEFVSNVMRLMKPENIHAIQVGNEPDHFEKKGWRRPGYTFGMYVKEFNGYKNAVLAVNRNFTIMGPSFAGEWRVQGRLGEFIDIQKNQVKLYSFHKYGLRGCSSFNTLNMLLDDSVHGSYQWISDSAAKAKAVGSQLVWGEAGTASCGGNDGISNVFGAALWTLDILCESVIRGVRHMLFSGAPQALYAPFDQQNVHNTMYGLLAFARFTLSTPSTQQGITLQFSRPDNYIKVYHFTSGTTKRVLVINKDPKTKVGSVFKQTINLGKAFANKMGSTVLLTNKLGVTSKNGTTFMGQTFMNLELTGVVTSTMTVLNPLGVTELTLPVQSAAIFSVVV